MVLGSAGGAVSGAGVGSAGGAVSGVEAGCSGGVSVGGIVVPFLVIDRLMQPVWLHTLLSECEGPLWSSLMVVLLLLKI